MEDVWERAARALPGVPTAVLRPAAVVGPGVDTVVTRSFEVPRLLALRERAPVWQFCHVDDLADAVAVVLAEGMSGALGAGAEGVLPHEALERSSGLRSVELPARLAHATAERLARLGLLPTPAGDLAYVVHPWAVSSERLRARRGGARRAPTRSAWPCCWRASPSAARAAAARWAAPGCRARLPWAPPVPREPPWRWSPRPRCCARRGRGGGGDPPVSEPRPEEPVEEPVEERGAELDDADDLPPPTRAQVRASARAVAALVCGAASVALVSVVALLPVPFAVEGPGPVRDVLSGEGDQRLITITGAQTYPTTGSLDLTTVSVRGGPGRSLDLGGQVAAWLDDDSAVLPEAALFPPGATEQQVDESNAAAFTDSQQSATVAALTELGYDVPVQVVVTDVVDSSGAAGKLRDGDVVTRRRRRRRHRRRRAARRREGGRGREGRRRERGARREGGGRRGPRWGRGRTARPSWACSCASAPSRPWT
ncbi:MAG: hypothetical protein PGN11_18715 [Quadrisphaera sp.]